MIAHASMEDPHALPVIRSRSTLLKLLEKKETVRTAAIDRSIAYARPSFATPAAHTYVLENALRCITRNSLLHHTRDVLLLRFTQQRAAVEVVRAEISASRLRRVKLREAPWPAAAVATGVRAAAAHNHDQSSSSISPIASAYD